MKKCSKCEETKELSKFSKNRVKGDGLQGYCKHCITRIGQQGTHLKRRYGISIEEYKKIAISQNNKCAICRKVEARLTNKRKNFLSVDHCHNTGKIRGLLCNACNIGLGKFKDNPLLLKKALKYLG
jgi:hypothetical protein